MKISIKKNKMKQKKNYCEHCKNFLFSTKENGYLEFRNGLNISSNGTEFRVKCSCGHVTIISLEE